MMPCYTIHRPPTPPTKHQNRFGGKSVFALEKMRGEIQARLDKGEETGLDVDYWENVLAELHVRLYVLLNGAYALYIHTYIYVHVLLNGYICMYACLYTAP